MHPKTSEIIENAAKMADYECERLAKDIDAFIINNKRGVSFMSSLWNIYPQTRGTDASLFRYKELCFQALKAWSIPAVHTEYLGSDLSTLPEVISESDITYPCVVKINAGSGGQGVYTLETESKANVLSQEIITKDTDYCLQQFIDSPEYRIFIDHGIVRFLYRKNFVENGKRRISENVFDDTFTPLFNTIPDYIQEWAYTLYKKTSAPIIGADVFIKDDISVEQKITVLELNHNPGLGILYEAGYQTMIVKLLADIFTRY